MPKKGLSIWNISILSIFSWKNALRSFWARYRASFITKSTQNVINKFSVCGFVAMTSERGQTTTVNFLNVVKAWENNVLHQNVNAQLCILHMYRKANPLSLISHINMANFSSLSTHTHTNIHVNTRTHISYASFLAFLSPLPYGWIPRSNIPYWRPCS